LSATAKKKHPGFDLVYTSKGADLDPDPKPARSPRGRPIEGKNRTKRVRPVPNGENNNEHSMTRIRNKFLEICRAIGVQEGTSASAVVNRMVQLGLMLEGYLLPVKEVVGEHLFTADGTVIKIETEKGA
jgi:hypothetical protein